MITAKLLTFALDRYLTSVIFYLLRTFNAILRDKRRQ